MQWYETEEGAQRLALECQFLEEDYPKMELSQCPDGLIRVSGYLGPSNLSQRSIYIVAELPRNYPSGRVRVYAPKEIFRTGTPHLYPMTDCELCIEHGDFTPDDTVSTALGWTVEWIALYDAFCNTGERW